MDEEESGNKGPESPAGAPMWMATFADLATLLMCFFVLILSFSEMDLIKYKQIAGSMKEAFGVQRDLKTKQPPRGTNVIAREFSPGRPKPTPLNRVKQNTTDNLRRYLKLKAVQQQKSRKEQPHKSEEQERSDARAAVRAQVDAEHIRQLLEKEIKAGLVEVGAEDQKVVIRIREKGTFPSGSAELLPAFVPVLGRLAGALGNIPGQVVVAGHTDDRPIRTRQFRSNWELSASRAVSVVHSLLEQSDLSARRFQVTGFGDTQPLNPNDSAAGRANNRRVELTIVRGEDDEAPGKLDLDKLIEAQPESPLAPPPDTQPQDINQIIYDNEAVIDELIDGYSSAESGDMVRWLKEGLSFLLGGDSDAEATGDVPPPVEIRPGPEPGG